MSKDKPPFGGASTILIFVILGLVVWGLVTVFQQQPTFAKFSDFQRDLDQGHIKAVSIVDGPGYPDITYVKKDSTETFRTRGRITDKFADELSSKVDVDYPTPTLWSSGLTSIFGILFVVALVFGVWYFLFRQAQNTGAQAFAFGKSRAKLLIDNKPKTTFEDVAGLDEAKEELREVIEFLKSTEKFRRVGARIPKGVLLVGPPGCGKTLLARAVAGEAAVPFVHISGSEFVELFVGVGASRVRDLFTTAEKNAPCVVFIDEIDAVGRQRGAGLGGGHDEREQTLNQLLVEMDGFDTNRGVVILAATNRPDILDPALLRPGRFDRRVVIDRPDQKGRLDILKVHSRNVPLGSDVDLTLLAQRTPGFTGADLANMVNEAAILAARENKLKVDLRHFEEAIERVIAGPQRKSRIIGEKEKEIVAFHEGGHALLGWVLPFADKVHKISILPRGLALGYTLQLPEQDKYLMTKNELLDKMTVLLGGRVAEETIFDEVSTGAQNDLEELTELARRMVKEYGMSVRLGPITFGKHYGSVFLGRDIATERDYSEDTAEQIDQEVHSIVEAVHERAREIVLRFKEALKKIAHELMERENIEKDEFTKMMTDLGVPANSERNTLIPEVSA